MCKWCAGRIEKGERANHRVYVLDGDFHSEYMHPECNAAMNESDNDYLQDGWMPGDFERGQAAL